MESTVYTRLESAKAEVKVARGVINFLWLGGIFLPPLILGLLSMWFMSGNCTYAQSLGKIPSGYTYGGIVTMVEATPAQIATYCTEVRNSSFLVFAIPSGLFFFFASSALRLWVFGKVVDTAKAKLSLAEEAVKDFELELQNS